MSATNGRLGLTQNSWGTYPTEQRQAELEGMRHAWEGNRNDHRNPFDGISLSGADVFWLAIQAVPNNISRAKAEQLLRDPYTPSLIGPIDPFDLSRLHLEGTYFIEAHLEGAHLPGAHLEGAYFVGAHLERAILTEAHLEGAHLLGAHLEGAILAKAILTGANLRRADLRGADLRDAHLEGTVSPPGKVVRRADLQGATFDARTNLADVTLGDIDGFVSVADTAWNGVNLANVAWDTLCSPWGQLGDEKRARNLTAENGVPKTPERTLTEYQAAARAYRQLSVALQAQGLTEQSVWLGYRAQILQHTVLTLQLASLRQSPRQGPWRQRVLEEGRLQGRVLFSRVLDRVAGYGYKPGKSITSYLSVQLAFITLYLLIGLQNFVATGSHIPVGSTGAQAAWTALVQAFILSVTSFHGRAFLPWNAGGFVNNAPLPTALMYGVGTAFEAVFGLLIEAILVATLIQRFFR